MRVVGDWRPPDADYGATSSAHKSRPCTAVDLRIKNNNERHLLLKAAYAEDCPRIGIYTPTEWQEAQYGKGAGSVHLDFSDKPIHPQDRTWMRW